MNPFSAERTHAFSQSSRWGYWWPAIFWAVVIALFSSSWFSTGHTWGYFIRLTRYLFPGLSLHELQALHAVFRKLAHFTVYFVFSLLLFRAARRGRPGWHRRWSLESLLVAVLYAGADELHQLFTPERTGAFRDVGIDTLGAVVAQLLLWLVVGRWAIQFNRKSTPGSDTSLDK